MNNQPAPISRARLALAVRDIGVAEQQAEVLRKEGFRVLAVSPRGVDFEGEVLAFEKTFQTPLTIDPEPQFAGTPVLPAELSELVDSVYFPVRPLFVGAKTSTEKEEANEQQNPRPPRS